MRWGMQSALFVTEHVKQINVIVVSDLSGSVEVSHYLEGGIKFARVRLAVEFVWVLGCWLRGLV